MIPSARGADTDTKRRAAHSPGYAIVSRQVPATAGPVHKGKRMLERAAPICFVQGILLIVLSLAMCAPLWLMVAEGDVLWSGFAYGAAITFSSGLMLVLVGSREAFTLTTRQMFVLTTLSWLSIGVFAALPLYFCLELDPADAFFESVSGITTTGSTILTGLDTMSRGILLWRGLLQWMGGIGIIVLAIAVLPFLRVGGMRLFQTESSDWSDKVAPRSGHVAKYVATIYLSLTLLCGVLYLLAGMNGFDAVVHAMTSLATGGFANYDASMGHFDGTPSILWISAVFMILSGMPYTLHVALLKNRRGDLFRDQQVRGLLLTLGTGITVMFLYHLWREPDDLFITLTHSVFNVVSVLTTTGYASADYNGWGPFAVMFFFMLIFIGGCSGSTSGGLKLFRLQIATMMLWRQLRQLLHSQGVFAQKYNDRTLTDDVINSVVAFSFFYLLTIIGLALLLALLGLDFDTALSGAATAVANVGPGLGHIIGPAGNFASLPDAAKWLLAVGMILGRLEIMTVFVLLTPAFWRWS